MDIIYGTVKELSRKERKILGDKDGNILTEDKSIIII